MIHEIPLRYFDVDNNNLCPPYPDCLINQEPFTDVNNNGIWDVGEPFEDTNESGYYDEDQIGYQDTSECEECNGLPGDINEDGDIDVLDIVIMVDCLLIDDCHECSDITNDGETNVLDIVYLVDYILN